MTAVDTSVAVAAFASWHENHRVAADVLASHPRLIAHVALETYSVLTRLPPPRRAEPRDALAFLNRNFDHQWLVLPPAMQRELLAVAVKGGISGGSIYDALIAATARDAGETLLTLDRRAVPLCRVVGARVELIG